MTYVPVSLKGLTVKYKSAQSFSILSIAFSSVASFEALSEMLSN